jgi:UV DNA damage repair endonuclease
MKNFKIGFACKWIDNDNQIKGIKDIDDSKKYNTMTTTMKWIASQKKDAAEEKLFSVILHNTKSVRLLVERVAKLKPALRMVRISSEILPFYTHPDWVYFYQKQDVISAIAKNLSGISEFAKLHNVRLSMHPGQFCVLASADENIAKRSIEEFEYHADLARFMGYGNSFQDFKINIHISGKKGPEGLRAVYGKLSPEARNCITVENEEMSYGIESCLELSDIIPTVLDIHHHWIKTGNYIELENEDTKKVIDSWRGVRPTMHYSISREDILVGHSCEDLPNMVNLLSTGYKKQHLRAHSDFYWNAKVNQWAGSFLESFDIMCESKAKNLASEKFFLEINT